MRSTFCPAEAGAAAMRSQYKKDATGAAAASCVVLPDYRSEACWSSTSARRRGVSSTINTACQTGMPVEMPAMYALLVKEGAGFAGAVATTGGSVNAGGVPK